jgi:hypothetical protein
MKEMIPKKLCKKEDGRFFGFTKKCLYLNNRINETISKGLPLITDGDNKIFFIYLLHHVLFVEKQPSLL